MMSANDEVDVDDDHTMNDNESEAMSIMSDAAVAKPRSHKKRPIARKLSFGQASKAAAAALAAASGDDDDADIEALLPKKPEDDTSPSSPTSTTKVRQKAKRVSSGGSAALPSVSRQRFQIRRTRTLEQAEAEEALQRNKNNNSKPSSPRGAKKPVKAKVDDDEAITQSLVTNQVKTGSTVNNNNNNNNNTISDDDDDDDAQTVCSDVAVSAPPRPNRKPPPLYRGNQSLPKPPATSHVQNGGDVEQGGRKTVSYEEPLRDHSSEFERNKKKSRKDIMLGNKTPSSKRSFDSGISGHSKTSRTGSMNTDFNYNSDAEDLRSTYSRKSSATNRTPHRTLAEIRRQKSLRSMQDSVDELSAEEEGGPKGGCCGLSRLTWTIIVLTGIAGFTVGFVVPMWKKQQALQAEQLAKQQQAMRQKRENMTKPFMDSMTGGSLQDQASVFYWGDSSEHGEEEQDSSDDGNSTDADANDWNETLEEYQQGMAWPQEEAVEIPSIDVWKLFGDQPVDLPPLESADRMAAGAFNESHLIQTAQLYVQGMIHRNVRKPALRIERVTPDEEEDKAAMAEYVVPHGDTPLLAFDGEVPYPTAPHANSNDKYPQGDVKEWEDRLKHYGVHEADDTVQLDSTNGILYVAQGNRIDIVDTDAGTIRATITLPEASNNNKKAEEDEQLISVESDTQPRWKPTPPAPFIEQVLLTSTLDHLVVLVSNYTSIHQAPVKPLLQESLVTQVFTYELVHKGNTTDATLVTDEPHVVHGRVLYAAQASTNQHIHIVTSSAIDTSRLLQDPLERLYYPDRDDSIYVEEAVQSANEKYIPRFVKRLQEEVRFMSDSMHRTLIPLSQWVTGRSGVELSAQEQQLEHTIMAQHHLQELIVVTSFSIVQTTSDVPATATNRQAAAAPPQKKSTAAVQTSFLGPSGVDVVGSTDTHLTLTVPSYQWTDERVLQEATHILQWELGTISRPGSSQLAATRFQGLGTVPGRLVQSARQSCERRSSDLRMATVITAQWQLGVNDQDETVIEERVVRTSLLHVLDAETLRPRLGSPLELFAGELTLLSAVTYLEDCAFAFPLQPVNSADVNKTSVQVIDFYPATNDGVRIASTIRPAPSGFSPYLRKLTGTGPDGNEMHLVSIAENKTASGLSLGWTASVWDATDGANLALVTQHSLQAPTTLTDWTPQTFRLTPNGQLVLPMTLQNIGGSEPGATRPVDMTGFFILNVTASEINEHGRVVHIPRATSRGDCTQGDGDCPLGAKSFWLSPSVLTVGGKSVKATVVDNSGQPSVAEWSLSLP